MDPRLDTDELFRPPPVLVWAFVLLKGPVALGVALMGVLGASFFPWVLPLSLVPLGVAAWALWRFARSNMRADALGLSHAFYGVLVRWKDVRRVAVRKWWGGAVWLFWLSRWPIPQPILTSTQDSARFAAVLRTYLPISGRTLDPPLSQEDNVL